MKLKEWVGLLIIIFTIIGGGLGLEGIIFSDWSFLQGAIVFGILICIGLILLFIDLEIPMEVEED